ncbi:sporulation membrane protein YtaF [Gorillibacterium massiliense]|uniref:sporulation membrane protein YtaF n=1 Tax=Gorillibacterium massiliense TaxID=1280390 RepID=UPI0004BCA56C|nr:sporulation membrane protein YtaF [Gorillibacterium massiliense]
MAWLLIAGFTLSSSLDNLGVGITYGIRKIRVGFASNLLISIVCFLFSFSGILFGKWISAVLPGTLPDMLGAFMLLVIGFRILLLAVPRRQQNGTKSNSNPNGITSTLKNPETADLDKSNDIGWFESIILGVALSANALINGLSAGMLGFSPLVLSLTSAIGSFLTIWLGVWIGGKAAHIRIGSFTLGQFGTLISGILLLLIAAHNFF